MSLCVHGVPNGSYCHGCGRVIRATRTELDWSHYAQAPPGHDCPRCARCRKATTPQSELGRTASAAKEPQVIDASDPANDSIRLFMATVTDVRQGRFR